VPLLGIALVASSMVLVLVRYESRLAFDQLHRLDTERDKLNVEYGRLMLERATWSLGNMVERTAGERLSMKRPSDDEVVTLVVPPREGE
jgi:cell division protein FtsL